MKIQNVVMLFVALLFATINVVYAALGGSSVTPLDNEENSGDVDLVKPYENARNQFCEKPKGEKGCVDDTQNRTCTYTIFCIK